MFEIINAARPLQIILLIGAMLAITTGIICATSRKKVVKTVCTSILILVIVASAMSVLLYHTAQTHGATYDDFKTMPFQEILHRTVNTHKHYDMQEDDIKNLNDCYIMYYRFSCKDCIETYKEMQKFLKTNPAPVPIYYIATDSEIARKLLGKYGIAEVPGLVYIYPNGVTFLGKVLYYRQAGVDNAIFDSNAILELYEFRETLTQD